MDNKFEQIFKAIEDKSIKPKQDILYDGQIFDAIDNYIDESVLQLFSKSNKKVSITTYTKNFTKILKQV